MRLVRLSSWRGGVERRVARGRSGALMDTGTEVSERWPGRSPKPWSSVSLGLTLPSSSNWSVAIPATVRPPGMHGRRVFVSLLRQSFASAVI
eukprot:COSAG02_NODE_306_length_25175_cov_76.540118_16_plen_92_part_00